MSIEERSFVLQTAIALDVLFAVRRPLDLNADLTRPELQTVPSALATVSAEHVGRRLHLQQQRRRRRQTLSLVFHLPFLAIGLVSA